MTSIFIWKVAEVAEAATERTGCAMVRYDLGADWSLEESGESYQWIRQQKGTDSDSGHTYVYYEARRMPTDWMGSCWLESMVVSYRVWKEEGSSRWDQLGDWNRYVGPDTGHTVEEQWGAVQKWCRGEWGVPSMPHPTPASAPATVPPHIPSYKTRGSSRGRGLRPVYQESQGLRPVYQEHRSGRGEGRGGRGRGRGRGGGRGRGNMKI